MKVQGSYKLLFFHCAKGICTRLNISPSDSLKKWVKSRIGRLVLEVYSGVGDYFLSLIKFHPGAVYKDQIRWPDNPRSNNILRIETIISTDVIINN
ncbi:hypothetical protein V6Z12_A08G189800 [Gossypium hirsutum]